MYRVSPLIQGQTVFPKKMKILKCDYQETFEQLSGYRLVLRKTQGSELILSDRKPNMKFILSLHGYN